MPTVPVVSFTAPLSGQVLRSALFRALAALAVCSGLAQAPCAGEALSPLQTLMFTIRDDQGVVIANQDVSSILSFDSSTGYLSTPVFDPNAPAAPAGWTWSSTDMVTGQ